MTDMEQYIQNMPETRMCMFNVIGQSLHKKNILYIVKELYPELLPFVDDDMINHNVAMYHLAKQLQHSLFPYYVRRWKARRDLKKKTRKDRKKIKKQNKKIKPIIKPITTKAFKCNIWVADTQN